ncbi:MAG: hypothetical protein A2Z90_21090 [Burkholderiales bacterium GWA2_64_37]|nr:MAG: hypothetical protein A2Z90_21090 [Burkholderiales bacterium GWA2_64_37]HCE94526.1 type I restriction endonuclease subunit S [Acidovorax sp.]
MLLSNLDVLATAPGGVARLRELILTLAVQGKLVPQDPADEPASVLLQKIRAEKDRLIAAKAMKREKSEPARTDDELPFGLPDSWSWVALGDVIDIIRGITFPADQKTKEAAPGRIACLRTSNVQLAIEWDDLLFVDRSFMGREDQLIQHHDIVMSMANSRELVGKVALIEHVPHAEATFGGFLGVLRPRKIEPRYAMAVLRTPYARSLLIDSSSQTTNIANVSLAKLRPLPFPLPPEAEQSRIVTRVEELMHLCDALQAKGQLEATQHAQLVSTLLGTLTASTTPEELADHWQRVAQHFDLLLDRPEAIDALEQTLLQLSVRGLLVPQDPTDEPANQLLARLRSDRAAWLATRASTDSECRATIKKLRDLPDADYPFSIPLSWRFVRLLDCCQLLVDCHNKTAPYAATGIPIIRTSNIRGGRFRLDDLRYVTEETYEFWSRRCPPEPGDIMFTREAPMGEAAIIPPGAKYCLGQRTMLVRPMHEFIDKEYLLLTLTEPHLLERAAPSAIGSTVKHLRVGDVEGLTIPLAPLAEQSRIVTRVTALRRLCADLRQRLADAQTTQSHLAQALMESTASV